MDCVLRLFSTVLLVLTKVHSWLLPTTAMFADRRLDRWEMVRGPLLQRDCGLRSLLESSPIFFFVAARRKVWSGLGSFLQLLKPIQLIVSGTYPIIPSHPFLPFMA